MQIKKKKKLGKGSKLKKVGVNMDGLQISNQNSLRPLNVAEESVLEFSLDDSGKDYTSN